MRTYVWTFSMLMLMLGWAAACSPSTQDPNPVIQPDDFAILPCQNVIATRPCALVVAGGKRVLFGAPSGAATSFNAADLKQLDAVMLFSLRAVDIEGLDDVRNHSWRAGRDAALLVIGPAGLEDVVNAHGGKSAESRNAKQKPGRECDRKNKRQNHQKNNTSERGKAQVLTHFEHLPVLLLGVHAGSNGLDFSARPRICA